MYIRFLRKLYGFAFVNISLLVGWFDGSVVLFVFSLTVFKLTISHHQPEIQKLKKKLNKKTEWKFNVEAHDKIINIHNVYTFKWFIYTTLRLACTHKNIFSHTLIVYCSFIGKFLCYTKQLYTQHAILGEKRQQQQQEQQQQQPKHTENV